MEIQFQYTDGETLSFAVADEQRGIDLVNSIRPSEFFHQPRLRIQVGKQTSILDMMSIESIYFATSLEAKIREQPPATRFAAISEHDYQERLEQLRRQYETDDNLFAPGNRIDSVVALHCRSGKNFFLQAELITRHRADQLLDLHFLFERLTSVIPCAPQGYLAINPQNIKKIDMYPAPRETMLTAWLVD